MQERYLGDSHDFLKYALLRHLHFATGLSLGVNWYLTRPEIVDRPGNNDGEKRHHLKGGVWRETDPDLFERIARFEDPAARTLGNIATWQILPGGTAYFADDVGHRLRGEWHGAALEALQASDLVFIDPDNGFEVKSTSVRTRPKYALYDEAKDYLEAGKAVVAIQFARQCDPVQRAIDIRETLISICGDAARLPVVRGRVAPNLLFFTIAPARWASGFTRALDEFVAKCGKAELID